MADQPKAEQPKPQPAKPTDSFSELVTQWERNFDAFANQVMGTEGFSQAMNEMQKAQLSYQRMFSQSVTQQLAAMNIPSREDIMSLAEAVQAVDRRLANIEATLVPAKPKPKRKRPPRTKQPPATDEEQQT